MNKPDQHLDVIEEKQNEPTVSQLLQPEEQVLSTLEKDGSRHWLNPKVSKGRFLTARRIVAYVLILIFTALPYIHINGKPAVLLDIVHRRFTIFGFTFLPTDTILLALFMLALLLSIFLVTALLGRIWCGWACPQTIYMEFMYRPIERLFNNTTGRGGKSRGEVAPWKNFAKYAIYLLLSVYLAHTFLAYFVGVDNLAKWITGSPLDHPVAFLVMIATTFLMMFDFSYFREQMCIIACPYGRLQSVLLDRQSLIISYDEERGEPRGKIQKNATPPQGDCIDCHKCVTTCPTGIDIRQGLQLECIGCAQCIDACDDVMEKINKPKGLIRYSTQAALNNEPVKFLRPRVILYPLAIAALLTIFTVILSTKQHTDVFITRHVGKPFVMDAQKQIANTLKLQIHNRSDQQREYFVTIPNLPQAKLDLSNAKIIIPAETNQNKLIRITLPADAYYGTGSLKAQIKVTDGDTFAKTSEITLFGPATSKYKGQP